MAETLFGNHSLSAITEIHSAYPNTKREVAMKTSEKTSHTSSNTDSSYSHEANQRSEITASLNKYISSDDNSNEHDDIHGGARRDSGRFPNGRSPRSGRKKHVASTTNEKPKRRASRNATSDLLLNDKKDGKYGEYSLNDEGEKPPGSPDSVKSVANSAKRLFDRAVRAASPGMLRRARSKSPGASKLRMNVRVHQESSRTDDGNDDTSERRHASPGRLRKKIGELDISQGERSTSSKNRPQSPGRLRKRSQSPGRMKKRAESPGKLKKRAESPGRLKKRPESPGRLKKKVDGIGMLKNRPESPGRLKKRPESPGKLKNRAESPGRLKKRAESPGRLKKRADSPGRLSRSTRSSRRTASAADDKNSNGLLGAMLERETEGRPRRRETRSVASAPVRKQTSGEGYSRKPRSSRSSRVEKSESSGASTDKAPSIPRRSLRERFEEQFLNDEQCYSNTEDELMRHKVKRNKSLDPGMARAVERLRNFESDECNEEKDNLSDSEHTRPAIRRAASMLLTREMGRRGKQNSFVELVQYKEEEIHSTSYFASNHVLINRERMKRGLRPLTRNIAMDELARKTAEEMAKSNGLNSLQTTYVGNVLRGESIRSIHRSVMLEKQGRERANVLNPYFQDFGVGTCKGEDGQLYMCQLFSERLELALTDTLTHQNEPKREIGEKEQNEERGQKEP
mmetsp:Transcript_5162/g.15029  ORF Transcript_5162/g.15029 Transcript_5162/m.15029 type:complete len:684 (-) Transcript_5162:386-2437(-)|eukprot:CAMPEP_0172374084 /NCGR_PEP_ID=MMETSP1060-20121228/54377_1 /TAXON_ID=37318 /ORGANISM="Pseudo-nitzschia pungens, Strain cf. cingulata" /LENGTH=683 /DNA_ID=CAMNT_0013100623 /DNA_START=364 /DNA_END=2415 /DNA_ORIENTATION=+